MNLDYHMDSVQKKKRSPRLLKIIAILLIAAGLVAGVWYIFFRPAGFSFPADFPGTGTGSFAYRTLKASVDMETSFHNMMAKKVFAAESYQIAGANNNPPAVYSENIYFSDQVELLEFYVEKKDRASFNKLNQLIREKFLSQNGLFVKKIDYETFKKPAGKEEILVSDQIRYCRVLIEACVRFKQQRDLDAVKTLSSLIYPLCSQSKMLPPEISIAVAKNTPSPDFSATPTMKPSVAPTPNPADITYKGVVNLASIDLYGLKLLSFFDGNWTGIYENCLKIVSGAALDEPVPFYAAGYDLSTGAYIPYFGNNPEFVFEDQMSIILHLAEVSKMRESTYAFLKQQLFNTKTYYQTYNILTGNSSTEYESIAGYARMARIARIRQDQELYDLCASRINWNTATSTESSIYALPFQKWDDGRIVTYSDEVILSLKAIY